MDEKRRQKIEDQVKRDRAARRKLEIEQGGAKTKSKVHDTTKRSRQDKEKNTLKEWEDES